MNGLKKVISFIESNFDTRDRDNFKDESGITNDIDRAITKVGYATNLTPEVVDKAHRMGIDLILTHHDAWEFIFGLKEECNRLLKKYNIAHYYNHLPLDDAKFGTNSSVAKLLGLKELKKSCNAEGYLCSVIGEYEEELDFGDFVKLVEETLGEKVQKWKFNNKKIKKVYILCGAGHMTSDIKDAVEEDCDLYLSGEKILYSVEYARHTDLNMVIGSHTYIELFGVKSMAELITKEFKDIEVLQIQEEHLEAIGFS